MHQFRIRQTVQAERRTYQGVEGYEVQGVGFIERQTFELCYQLEFQETRNAQGIGSVDPDPVVSPETDRSGGQDDPPEAGDAEGDDDDDTEDPE